MLIRIKFVFQNLICNSVVNVEIIMISVGMI